MFMKSEGASSPLGGMGFLSEEEGDSVPRPPGKGLPSFAILFCLGDILTLLEKGHFNFARSGDILTLP